MFLLTKQHKKILGEKGVSVFTPLLGPLTNGLLTLPVFIALQRIVRNVPEAHTAGALWFPDLTVPDPYYILPAIAGGLMLLVQEVTQDFLPPFIRTSEATLQINARDGAGVQTQKVRNIMRGITVGFGLFGATFPSAITLLWSTNYVALFLQQQLFKNRLFGKLAGIKYAKKESQNKVKAAGFSNYSVLSILWFPDSNCSRHQGLNGETISFSNAYRFASKPPTPILSPPSVSKPIARQINMKRPVKKAQVANA